MRQQELNFGKKITKIEIIHMGLQKVHKSDFQSQFQQSKIVRVFLIFFSLKNRSRVFVIEVFEPVFFLKWGQFLTVLVNICESQIKNIFSFTDFFAKIYSLMIHARKTPPFNIKKSFLSTSNYKGTAQYVATFW